MRVRVRLSETVRRIGRATTRTHSTPVTTAATATATSGGSCSSPPPLRCGHHRCCCWRRRLQQPARVSAVGEAALAAAMEAEPVAGGRRRSKRRQHAEAEATARGRRAAKAAWWSEKCHTVFQSLRPHGGGRRKCVCVGCWVVGWVGVCECVGPLLFGHVRGICLLFTFLLRLVSRFLWHQCVAI